MWQDAKVTIPDITDDVIRIELPDGLGMDYPLSRLLEYADGLDATETLLRNIAVRLSLSGIDITDTDRVKAYLNSATFKSWSAI